MITNWPPERLVTHCSRARRRCERVMGGLMGFYELILTRQPLAIGASSESSVLAHG